MNCTLMHKNICAADIDIDEDTGVVLMNEDIASVEQAIISMCESGNYSKDACIERAKQFDSVLKYNEYLSLFENI